MSSDKQTLSERSFWPGARGDMAMRIRAHEWAETPLGPIENWPQSLKTTVDLMLGASAQIVLFWGPEFIALYNDAYAPTIGDKHPHALGRPAREHWAELWDDLEPLLASVRESGETVAAKDRPFCIERHGYPETAYFDISYSAAPVEDGQVGGVLCIVSETTGRVLLEKQLRDNDARLALAIEIGGIGHWELDLNTQELTTSALCRRNFGRDPDAPFSYDELIASIHPDDRERQARAVAAAIKTRSSFEIQYRAFTPAGEIRWIEVRGKFEAHHGRDQLAGVSIDVTERKQVQEHLRRTANTFFRLIQNAPFGTYVIDADFRIVEASQTARETFGRKVDPLIGRDLAEALQTIWPEPFASETIGRFRHTLSTGEPFISTDTVEQRADRDAIEAYDWRIDRIVLPDGRFGVVCYYYDLSERQRLETALRESESLLRQFGDASTDVLWIRNAETLSWDYLSPAFETIYGAGREAALEGNDLKNWVELILPEDRQHALDCIRRVREGESVTFEYRIARPSGGQVRWLRDTDFPLFDDEGKVHRIGGVGQDVTEEKKTAERMQVLVAELQHRTRNLLSVVQSIAHQTMHSAASFDAFKSQFSDRLLALSRVQGLLSRAEQEPITIGALIGMELDALGFGNGSGKITIEGPVVPLKNSTVQTLALALHELATNARKHGALAQDEGHLNVTWSLANSNGQEPRLDLDWIEEDVPGLREKTAGETDGFGRVLIERALPYSLGARTYFALGENGVRCRIELPLAR